MSPRQSSAVHFLGSPLPARWAAAVLLSSHALLQATSGHTGVRPDAIASCKACRACQAIITLPL